MKFLSSEVVLYLYKSTKRSRMEYCCHVWTGHPNCYLDRLDKLQKLVWVWRTCLGLKDICQLLPLEPLVHRRNVATLSLPYQCYFGRCTSELAELVPLPHFRNRPARYRLHDFLCYHPYVLKEDLCQQFLYLHSLNL